MNDQLKMIVSSFTTGYESFKNMLGEETLTGLTAIYQEILRLAEENSDLAKFSQAAATSGVFNRFSQESQKLSTLWQTRQKDPATKKEPTLADLRRQIGALAKDAAAQPFLFTYQATLNEYVALANSVTDLKALNTLAEKAQLNLRMATAPVYDSHKLLYDKTDPNETIQRQYFQEICALAQNASSAAALTAGMNQRAAEFADETARESFLQFAVVLLVNRLLSYNLLVGNIRRGLFQRVPDSISALLILRQEIKSLHLSLKDDFGLTWEKLPWRHRKIFLAQEMIFTFTDRAFKLMHPDNLKWLDETLREEIRSELSLPEILLRKPTYVFNPTLTLDEVSQRGLDDKATALAKEKWGGCYWFKGQAKG